MARVYGIFYCLVNVINTVRGGEGRRRLSAVMRQAQLGGSQRARRHLSAYARFNPFTHFSGFQRDE